MSLPLRRVLSSFNRSSLLRAAAIAASASGLAYAHADPDNRSKLWVSLSVPMHTHLEQLWYTEHGKNSHLEGILAPLSIRDFPIPSGDAKQEAPDDINENKKRCPGCLGRDTTANAAARVGPAVVHLSVSHSFYGISRGRSSGSGTIIHEDGTILTCAHVVVESQGPRSSEAMVAVTLQDGRMFEDTVLNADMHSDVAVVKINSKTPLPTEKLSSSSKLRPGDWVLAIGCPFSLQNTVTAGIVSCVDRKSSELGLGGMRREYLQVDCAVNVGNSGGPLVNIDGEVVGVNNLSVSGANELNFSVPIDSVSKIIEHFKKSG